MKRASLIKRGIAWCCDLCSAFLLSCLSLKIFAPPFHWSTITFIGFFTLCYFLLCQFIWKRSFFQHLFGIHTERSSWKYFGWKMLLGVITPMLFFLFKHPLRMHIWDVLLERFNFEFLCISMDSIGENNGRVLCALFWLIPLGLAECIYFLIRKKTFAEQLGKTQIVQTSEKIHPAVVGTLAGMMVLLIVLKPVQQRCIEKKYGFPAYNATPSFPYVPAVEKQRYIRDFQANKQDAQSYILGLFDKYDIVYLIEREHPEYTQWDFFSQLILNDTFAEKVGCLATEYGGHFQQEEVDTFMSTPYASDTDRQKAAAHIIRSFPAFHPCWLGCNIFDFITNLQKYNITHDSAHQIRWFPGSGSPNWENIAKDPSDSTYYAMNKQHDSSIAQTIIHSYQERQAQDSSKNKMLVIVNHLHGFRGLFRHYRTCIDQVETALPVKVGVVLLPTASIANMSYNLPIDMGVWEEAASAIDGDFVVPIKGSLLEKQYYMGAQAPENIGKIKLGQLFDAVLFYRSPREFIFEEKAFPHFWDDNFEDTLSFKTRALFGESYNPEKFIKLIKNLEGKRQNASKERYNKLYDAFFYIVYTFLLLGILTSLLPVRKKTKDIKSEDVHE